MISEVEQVFYNARDVSGESGIAAVRYLLNKGVSFQAAIEPDPVVSARVATSGKFFDVATPEQDGERAILILCWDYWGPLDIAAWMPTAGKIYTYAGSATMLGESQIYGVGLEAGLRVYRDPLAWFRAGRQGIVILNPKAAAERLDGLGPLIAEDPEHATWLQRNLARPAPKILVPNPARKAA
ncbi:hypothetical protein LMIY3S_04763 [Labrys miyagiensis]